VIQVKQLRKRLNKLTPGKVFSDDAIVIQGTVINLAEMKDKQFSPRIKATLLVNKVVLGDTSLKGKRIKTEFGGGIAKTKEIYTDIEGNYLRKDYGYTNPQTRVFVSYSSFPIPQIFYCHKNQKIFREE